MKFLVVPFAALALMAGSMAGGSIDPREEVLLACKGADGYVRTIAGRTASGDLSLADAEAFNSEQLPWIKMFCLAEAPPAPEGDQLQQLSDALLRAQILAGGQ